MFCYVTDDRAAAERVIEVILSPMLNRPAEVLRERLVGPAEVCAERLRAYRDWGRGGSCCGRWTTRFGSSSDFGERVVPLVGEAAT